MAGLLADAAGELAPAGLIVLALLAWRRGRHVRAAVAFVALYFADAVVTGIGVWAPGLQVPGSGWNWTGKAAGLLLAAGAFLMLPAAMRGQVGLFRLPPRRRWLELAFVTGVLVTFAVGRTLAFSGGAPFSVETLAFQASMPGLHEEMTFRGVWWVLLAAVLDRGEREDSFPWWTLIATTLLFGCVHAVDVTETGIRIEWLFLAATLVSGLLYGLLQGLGRALWVPVLAHGLVNVAISLCQMFVPR